MRHFRRAPLGVAAVSTVDVLERISGLLDIVESKAVAARAELAETHAQALAASASLENYSQGAELFASSVSKMGSQAVTDAEAAGAAVEVAFAKMSSTSQAGERVTASAATAVQGHAASVDSSARQVATRLDDLVAQLQASADAGNVWAQSIEEMIGEVKLGTLSLDRLLQLYGDADVGGKRLRQFLQGLDIGQYTRQISEFIEAMRKGQVTLDDVVQLLAGSNVEFAKQFAKLLELFKQGKVTLQAVAEAVAKAAQIAGAGLAGGSAGSNTAFTALTQAILQGLQDGTLG
jgi:hypothetical protein